MSEGRNPLADGFVEEWATDWGEDRFGVFATLRVADVAHRMRWVPPGSFIMGSPKTEAGRYEDEGPQHIVHLTRGFWLGETPCTQALWKAVVGDDPSHFKGDDRPVEQVSWNDCQVFFSKLERAAPGFVGRLPTEAEWEYACRAATTAATWVGELDLRGGEAPNLDPIAWYGKHSGGETHPVAKKAPNPFGLYDMLGNVEEWCADWEVDYDARPAIDPAGLAMGTRRVFRGGSWLRDAGVVRAAFRYWRDPGRRDHFLGFRLARGHAPGPEDRSPEGSGSVSQRGGAPSVGERSRRP